MIAAVRVEPDPDIGIGFVLPIFYFAAKADFATDLIRSLRNLKRVFFRTKGCGGLSTSRLQHSAGVKGKAIKFDVANVSVCGDRAYKRRPRWPHRRSDRKLHTENGALAVVVSRDR